ncbi:hypothetical protein DFH06DRAFT_1132649 [Mycena polygramma]|nr:hypothetical protein DFH06DRAFT_1132649 [Mycena polygramma]
MTATVAQKTAAVSAETAGRGTRMTGASSSAAPNQALIQRMTTTNYPPSEFGKYSLRVRYTGVFKQDIEMSLRPYALQSLPFNRDMPGRPAATRFFAPVAFVHPLRGWATMDGALRHLQPVQQTEGQPGTTVCYGIATAKCGKFSFYYCRSVGAIALFVHRMRNTDHDDHDGEDQGDFCEPGDRSLSPPNFTDNLLPQLDAPVSANGFGRDPTRQLRKRRDSARSRGEQDVISNEDKNQIWEAIANPNTVVLHSPSKNESPLLAQNAAANNLKNYREGGSEQCYLRYLVFCESARDAQERRRSHQADVRHRPINPILEGRSVSVTGADADIGERAKGRTSLRAAEMGYETDVHGSGVVKLCKGYAPTYTWTRSARESGHKYRRSPQRVHRIPNHKRPQLQVTALKSRSENLQSLLACLYPGKRHGGRRRERECRRHATWQKGKADNN